METESIQSEPQNKRSFYSPVIIATYCVLFLPVGVFLFGKNMLNRGVRVMAIIYIATAVLLLAFVTVAAIYGTRVPSMWIFGAAAAAFVIWTESEPFKHQIRLGGQRARWWPPLLWVIGWFIVLVVLLAIFGDVEAVEHSA